MQPSSTGLPRAHGEPIASGLIRSQPEDFMVHELLPFEPDGAGEHLLLQVTKTGQNTAWVARQLAQAAGIPPRDVSYAGRKDRNAVTTQWFCLRIPSRSLADPAALLPEGCVLDQYAWHRRKLRPGSLSGNRFRIRVRELAGDREALQQRLEQIAGAGVPNYYTEQRFGRSGSVTEPPPPPVPRGREARSLWISATRSAFFNRVLAARVRDGSWCRARPGELLILRDSHSHFGWDGTDSEVPARVVSGELHPSGPLVGAQGPCPDDEVAELERAAVGDLDATLALLQQRKVEAARRALRVMVADLSWEVGDDLMIELRLPPGSYATAVLRELVDYRLVPDSST
jgi:tRNA pseudouridine13 synthase